MPGFGALKKFFGRTIADAAGYAAGGAVASTLEPELRALTNEAWSKFQSLPPDAGTLAEGVAQGQVAYNPALAWANQHGLNKKAFDALVSIANVGPGLAQAFNLWRRKQIDEAGFRRALTRLGLEKEWIDDLWAVRQDVLSPGEVAAAIHRGLIPDPGLLKGEQPSGARNVEAYPVYPINAGDEAEASGYDHDHLGVLVGLQGLPMGPVQAAEAYFKGILTHGDYIAAFNESNQRNEWAQAYLENTRQIPTARDYIENALRGYRTFTEAAQGAARHGMSEQDAELIFQNSGRAMNLHQITQALAYGASYNPTPADDPDPYHQSTLVGPLRPEYYELNEALKYTLPSALYFRTLQQNGVLSRDEAAMWYRRLGWPPELADQVATAFAKQRATTEREATAADWLTLYDGGKATEAQTRAALGDLGYPPDEVDHKITLVAARKVASARTSTVSALGTDYRKGKLSADAVQAALVALAIDPTTADQMVTAWAQYIAAEAQTQA